MWNRRLWTSCVMLPAIGLALGCGGASPRGSSDASAGMAATAAGDDANGVSGSAPGSAGAENGTGAVECKGDDGMGPSLWVVYVGSATLDEGYEGPATVEQSAVSELLLDFESSSGPHQMRILGEGSVSKLALPLFPIGALIWVNAKPAGEVPTPPEFGGAAGPPYVAPSAWSVRDRENGTLLLGGAFNSHDAAAPIEIGDVIDGCAEPNPECIGPDALRIHQSLELVGDQVVTLEDGQSGAVTLNGLEYAAHVNARRDARGTRCVAPANYYVSPESTFRTSLQLKDPELLIAALPQTDPP